VAFVDLLYVFVIEQNVAKLHSLVWFKVERSSGILLKQPSLTMASFGHREKLEE